MSLTSLVPTLMCLCSMVSAQLWVRTFDGGRGEDDWLRAMVLDSADNPIVTGQMSRGLHTAAGTAKIGRSGESLWVVRYDPCPGFDQRGNATAPASDGGTFAAVASKDSSGAWGYATVHYDDLGRECWVARYSYTAHRSDFPYGMTAFPSGRCVVTGTSGRNSTDTDLATVSYTSSGDTEWVRRYDGPAGALDGAQAVAAGAHGIACVTGYAAQSVNNRRGTITIAYDSLGDTMWTSTLASGDGNLTGCAIVVDSDAYAYVAGVDETRFLTLKLNPAGETLWTRRYFLGAGVAISTDASGCVYVTGTDNLSGLTSDIVTLKYDSAGKLLWDARYDGPDGLEDWGYDLALGPDGSVYVCGSSQSARFGSECFLVKYTTAGDTAWTARIHGDGPYGTVGNAVAVDNDGDVILAGSINKATTGDDYLIAKYPPTGPGVAENGATPVAQLSMLSVSPTVVSRLCRLTVHAGEHQTSLSIADITGRTVRGIPAPTGRAGDRVSVTWDTRDEHGQLVPNGVYFVQVAQAQAQAQAVCKVIVQR